MLTGDYNAGADENIVSHVNCDAVFVPSNNRIGRYLWFAEWALHGNTPFVNPLKIFNAFDRRASLQTGRRLHTYWSIGSRQESKFIAPPHQHSFVLCLTYLLWRYTYCADDFNQAVSLRVLSPVYLNSTL